ncbi:unnamed protein product [Paramecium primaurelia]|uniref:Uncharacterized protein n=1 Tax=Paramecium primaurelia TaxID=5886 RepID=A0A8S1Q7N4_PARPR|nr:unnamed protein product [Paramecium primaurelia]
MKRQLVSFVARFVKQHPYLQVKTSFCQHEHGCLYNVLEGLVRSFGIAYTMKALFGLISALLSKNKKISKGNLILEAFFGIDTLKFASFPTVYSLIQKTIICGCRHITQQDLKIMSFVSGFSAGFVSLSLIEESKRKNWALYLLTRSMDTMFNSLINKNIVAKRSYYYIIFMAIEVLVTAYAFGCENDCLEDYMLKFYARFGNENQCELDERKCWHERVRRQFENKQ